MMSKFWRNSGISRPSGWLPRRAPPPRPRRPTRRRDVLSARPRQRRRRMHPSPGRRTSAAAASAARGRASRDLRGRDANSTRRKPYDFCGAGMTASSSSTAYRGYRVPPGRRAASVFVALPAPRAARRVDAAGGPPPRRRRDGLEAPRLVRVRDALVLGREVSQGVRWPKHCCAAVGLRSSTTRTARSVSRGALA